jgi:hypothetical protein
MPKIRGKQIADNEVTATQAETTTGTISTVNAGDAAVEGSGAGLSRRDHQHAVATGGTTADIDVGDAAGEGSSSNLAREDHQHALPAPAAPADVTKAAAAAGSATTVARADHKHDVTTAVAVELAEANAEGSATTLARSDHTHDHGNRSGGTLHSAATTGVNGFMSSTDKQKLDALVTPNLIAPKDSVRLKAVGDVATLSGNQTVDGVLTAPGERVALFNQSITTEDGIYITNAGAWTRAADFASGSSQAGSVFPVEEGTSNGDTFWQVTNDAGSDVVGTDDLSVLQIGSGSPRGAGAGLVLNVNDLDVVANADGSMVVNVNDIQVGVITEPQHGDQPLNDGLQHAVATGSFAGFLSSTDKTKLDGITGGAEPNKTSNQEDVTTENITGTDTVMTDTLNNTPSPAASLKLFLNGVKQQQGAGNDYTVSGASITWLASSGTAVDMDTSDVLVATYLS